MYTGLLPNTISAVNDKFGSKSFQNFLASLLHGHSFAGVYLVIIP